MTAFMDLSNLSSNWKKLRINLDKDKKKATNSTTEKLANPAPAAISLKRKAPSHLVLQEVPKLEKRQKVDSKKDTHTLKPPNKPHGKRMGNYISPIWTSAPASKAPPNDAALSNDAAPLSDAAPQLNGHADSSPSIKPSDSTIKLGQYLSLDTEMVGVTTPMPPPFSIPCHNPSTDASVMSTHSILARVTLMTYDLEVAYDAYVLPPQNIQISDYRTPYSGISAWHLNPRNETTKPKPFEAVQKEVSKLLEGRIVVGHELKGDLRVLGCQWIPRGRRRDTARHQRFRAVTSRQAGRREGGEGKAMPATGDLERGPGSGAAALLQLNAEGGLQDGVKVKGMTPSLKLLAHDILGWDIQGDSRKGHDSVEDAKAAMALFKYDKTYFQEEALKKYGGSAKPVKALRNAPNTEQRNAINDQGKKKDKSEDLASQNETNEVLDEDAVQGDELDKTQSAASAKRKPKKKRKKGKYQKKG